MTATISHEGTLPLTTFVQTWTVPSRECQIGLLATMRRRVVALTSQAGFVSMSVHRSDDGKRVVVYAQWRSQSELLAAVGSPEAMAGHDELVHWGSSDGGARYAVADVFGPHANSETADDGSPKRPV
jgi:hypothetical protein